MNQTPDLAAGLAANPPPELRELLNDPRTTNSAREAVTDLVKPPAGGITNGHAPNSSFGDGRLQIVNEKQDFTCVPKVQIHNTMNR